MTRRSIAVTAAGALVGAVLALMILALAAMFVAETAPSAIVLSANGMVARPEFVANAGAVYLFVATGAAVGGAIIAVLTAAIAGQAIPEEPRLRPRTLALVGAAISGVAAYATLRACLGVGAAIKSDLVAGGTTITISVFRALIVAVIVGAVAGSFTAVGAEMLSRPAMLGFTGPAWPKSAARFLAEMMPAVAVPLLAAVGILAVVVLISQLLLIGEESIKHFSVVAASGIAAAVLGGAAFVASHPRRKDDDK